MAERTATSADDNTIINVAEEREKMVQVMESFKEKIQQHQETLAKMVEKMKRGQISTTSSYDEGIPRTFHTIEKTSTYTREVEIRRYCDFTVIKKQEQAVIYGEGFNDDDCLFLLPIKEVEEKSVDKSDGPDKKDTPCKHITFLNCTEVEGQEFLVQSCGECLNIKLTEPTSDNEPTIAIEGETFGRMCDGEKNRLLVQINNNEVLELDCSNKKFSKLRTIKIGIENILDFYYIPNPHKLIVAISLVKNKVEATSCDDGKMAWVMDGAVLGRKIYPSDLLFLSSHGTLLVADGVRGRILVLNPNNGSHLQTIEPRDLDLPKNRVMCDLCAYKENQFVLLSCDYPGHIYSEIKEDVPMYVTLVKIKNRSETSPHFEMELLSFHELATYIWWSATVMKSTGLPVIYGQRTSKNALAIFRYYRDEEGSLRRSQIKAPCEHAVRLLCLEIAGQEFLAISCDVCENIRLMNLTSEKSRVAFRGKEVDLMAKGEGGKLYGQILGEAKVLELDLVSSTFVEGKSFDIGKKDVADLHYVPSPHRLIVVSHKSNKLVQAISVDTSKIVWNFDQKVDDKEIEPDGLLFLPEHDVILVADAKRIHIVRSADGELLQTVDQLGIGTISKPLLCKNKVAILSHLDDLARMSYFEISVNLFTPTSRTLIFVQ